MPLRHTPQVPSLRYRHIIAAVSIALSDALSVETCNVIKKLSLTEILSTVAA